MAFGADTYYYEGNMAKWNISTVFDIPAGKPKVDVQPIAAHIWLAGDYGGLEKEGLMSQHRIQTIEKMVRFAPYSLYL
jgi:hypothetical protein